MVRPPRIWDLPRILGSFLIASNGVTGVVPYSGQISPGLLATLSIFPFFQTRYRPFISRNKRSVGMALARARRETDQIDLSWLLVKPDGETNGTASRAVVRELLDAVCSCAAEEGVVSVFARLPEVCGYADEFRGYGFSVIVREHTYGRKTALPPEGREVEGLRAQEKPDAWGVQQLYRACTPMAVQLAENLTSRTWELPRRHGLTFLGLEGDSDSFVVDGRNGIEAWLRIRRYEGEPYRIRLIVHPSREGLATALLDFAMQWLSQLPEQPVVITVRDYEEGTLKALEEAAFQPLYTRLLMVRHLGIRFREAVLDPALGRVGN